MVMFSKMRTLVGGHHCREVRLQADNESESPRKKPTIWEMSSDGRDIDFELEVIARELQVLLFRRLYLLVAML